MTFSNGTYSPHPLANPFNTRLGGSNISLNPLINRNASANNVNPKDLQVPNQDVPLYGTPEWNQKYGKVNDLQVPNQDVPLGDQSGKQGFIRNSSIFRCHDGTIVDFRSRKVIYTPDDPNSQYWGNPNSTISRGTEKSWNDEIGPTIDQMINNIDQYYGRNSEQNQIVDIDPESVKYWIQAQEEAEKLKSQMTDYQKQMIAQFESHFPKSRLIEESKKCKDKRII